MKRLISRLRKMLPKRVAVAVVTVLAAMALPLTTLSAANVRIETSMGVANVTAGDTTYKEAVNASYDQIVKVQVYYHNMEDPNSNKVANDLRMKINVPTAAGKAQTISGTISSPDANTSQDSVKVNLDRDDAYLEYIPGSAVWKHNKGTNDNVQIVEEKISDNVVYDGQGLVLENTKPCFNFDATVTILVRVRVPGVKIVKQSRVKGSGQAWSNNNTAKPGEVLEYLITYQNIGNTKHEDVIIRDSLPPTLTYVPGSTYLTNSTNPNGVKYNSDDVVNGGIVIGGYNAGAGAYVKFEVQIPAADKLKCGDTEYRNVGVAHPKGQNEYYNTAITKVNKVCNDVPNPSYNCEIFKVEKLTGREIRVSEFKTNQANGATFTRVEVNWGDNTAPFKGNASPVGQKHTYAADSNYNIVATAYFNVNGQEKSATCQASVSYSSTPTPPSTPKALPNTGAGSVAGIVASVTAAGAIAHNVVTRRRKYQG